MKSKPLDSLQQEKFCHFLAAGNTAPAAGLAAGMPFSPEAAEKIALIPPILARITYLQPYYALRRIEDPDLPDARS